ncbi:MAG: cation:proton antiporter [Candidatus Aminicenantes bacterium]|nr:cation:proton antiporter [Candidatus Aminicenantes bacterium]
MDSFVYLRDLIIILSICVAVVAILDKLKIPAIAAFILAGMLIGPKGLGLIGDMKQVEVLAEVGVALLLYSIGLEMSLDRIKRLSKLILMGGVVQVGLSIAAVFLIALSFNVPPNTAIFMGFIVAVSSTAIVLSGLEARGEMETSHGRLTLGILLFQDLCVVPMMMAIPFLSGKGISGLDIVITVGKAAIVITGVLFASRLIVPRVLHQIARTRQRNLFVMAVLLICIGTAWLTTIAGVSLALGAFLAGLVVASSEYRHQAITDLIPFKEVFLSIFFVSVGMLLIPHQLVSNIAPIILLLIAVLAGKFIIVFLTAWIMRLPLKVMILAGVSLAQIGEFSFLLIRSSRGTGLLDERSTGNLIAVAILSMLLTPFALSLGPKIVAGVRRVRVATRLLGVVPACEADEGGKKWQNHVIIGGYGFAGKELALVLRRVAIPYLTVDLNVDNIRRAVANGDPAFFGDVTSPEILKRLGIERAREFVLVINDHVASIQAVKAARQIAPNIFISVRTRYILDVDPLMKAGASEVIPAEVEAAVEVAARVLDRSQLKNEKTEEVVERIREHPDH